MSAPQQYSLRWNNYFRHLTYALDNHRVNDDFVDVSLLCDGRKIKAHKVVLSACSSYFKEIFTENPHPHPVIIFKFIKYEDLNSIIEFMYQGEVNVQQEALQSFLQTAELLAVQGLTAEEKEKPKPPTPLIEEQKLMKSIPSTIRAVNDATTATQTIDIPLLHTTTQQIQIPHLQTQSQTASVPQQQQHHHVQTQIQHIQVHQNTSPTATHQVSTATGHHQQQLQVHHQVQQQSSQSQQIQVNTQPTQLSANIVTLPATASNSIKKRKITFSDDDDNIYTTETVDDQTIVKTADMTLLRGTIKMDIPEYIVNEVDDHLSDAGGTPGNNQDAANSGQNVTQYPSEYEILTESEIDDKFHQGDNSEMSLEMGRLLNPTTTTTSTSQNQLDDTTTSSSNVLTTIKTENKVCSTAMESKLDVILKNLERLEALPATIDVVLRKQVEFGIKVDHCLKKQDELANILGERNILLSGNLANLSVTFERFPVKYNEDLKTLEDELMGENREKLVASMRRLLCDDLTKNLERVFDSDLLSQYNYDGTKGKKALKSYSNFIMALKDCTSFDTFEKFLVDFRSAIKKVKNRDAKRHSRGKED